MSLQGNLWVDSPDFVIPADAGIQKSGHYLYEWIPACAGMTAVLA